jgi:hypothetical protein
MARQLIRTIAAKGSSALLLVLIAGGFLQSTAHAQVSVNVNIGAPPPVIVEAPPPMLFLAEPAVYVAVGVPYDIFFIEGRYYRMHGDNWFWAPGYGGPWVHVVYKSLPPGLRRYKVVQLREYREREYRVYKVQGNKFKGKYFYAVSDDRRHDDDDDHGHGKGHGNGKGKGH